MTKLSDEKKKKKKKTIRKNEQNVAKLERKKTRACVSARKFDASEAASDLHSGPHTMIPAESEIETEAAGERSKDICKLIWGLEIGMKRTEHTID